MIVVFSKAMPSKQTVLDKLNSFIDASSPKLATFLHHQINQQQNAVTYKELHEAIHQGQFPLGYLTKWQQDYSQFIIDHYAPMVDKAVKQAAIDLAGEYAGAIFDPQIGLMDDYIKTHGGKLIQQVTATQYNAINTLVRQASMTDTMTVDQLARAIRPCVGLTQRQAQYVKHYYDNLIDQGYSPQAALKKQAAYAAKVHRQRAQTIAETEMAYAYNAAANAVVQQNIKDGYFDPGVEKYWLTAADELVCDECGAIDGETVPIDAPFSIGVKLPPAHPRCRCAVGYKNIKVLKPAPAPASTAAQNSTPAQPQQPTIPTAPDPGALSYKSSVKMGTGEMHQYTDADGHEWIFKPAQSKFGGHKEPFRAYVQEAGYKVQGIVDPDTAVPVKALTLDTPKGSRFGAAQLRIEDTDGSFDLKSWQGGFGGTTPDASVIAQLQRENVTDWLMCNYDSHGGNFLRINSTGKLVGVDKEQAFRYITNPSAKKMSYSFHPNSTYGETEPIYNTLYRKFANGDIDIDLNDVLPYIQRVEAVPDATYREIFREYAEALHGKGGKAEALLDDILARKQGLRSSFRDFYSDILTQRTGTKTVFQFADEAAAAASKAPLTGTAMSSTSLQSMSLTDLKALAQKQGIKYAWNMNKTQLVDAISDPTKTAQIVADAKARAYGIGTTPKKPKATAPAAAKPAATGSRPKIDGITQLGDAMDDFDEALDNSGLRGVSLISDKAALEGMQTNLRKINIDGRDCYELSGKLTHGRWLSAQNGFPSSNVDQWTFHGATGKIDYTKPVLELTSANVNRYSIPTRYIRDGDDLLILTGKDCERNARAMMGEFSIRVFSSDGKDAAQKARALLAKAQLTDIFDDVDTKALDRYKKMRLIWQNDPALAGTLDPLKSTDADIQIALSRLGITQARVDKLKLVKVTDGYFTFYDQATADLAKKKGVAYVWSGVGSKTSATYIIESGEMTASAQRLKRGILTGGASVGSDIGTGGADNVFTRIAMQKNVGTEYFNDSFAHGDYQFIFDRKILGRTDWYAYTGDEFGTTQGSTFSNRRAASAHFDALNRRYCSSNETMFRKSVSLSDMTEIRCNSPRKKQELIDSLHSRGITEINGIKLEQFIKVGGGEL